MGNNNSGIAILKTLIYSDIFDFPLTKDEIWRYCISEEKVDKAEFEHALHKLSQQKKPKIIKSVDGFYCLAGREGIIIKRKENIREINKKLKIAKIAARYLSYIPTVYFIGLSGSLAAENVEKADDIDFFIVTKKNTLFTTRVLILAVLEMMNLRRKRTDENPKNKICVNLIIDENALSWSSHKHDLFVAREIIQIKPLFERNGMYKQFIQSNIWVSKFLPNAMNKMPSIMRMQKIQKYYTLQSITWFFNLLPIAILVRSFQKYYMQKHRSTEIITNHLLAFHPNDYRKKTLMHYQNKIERFFQVHRYIDK